MLGTPRRKASPEAQTRRRTGSGQRSKPGLPVPRARPDNRSPPARRPEAPLRRWALASTPSEDRETGGDHRKAQPLPHGKAEREEKQEKEGGAGGGGERKREQH